MVISGVCLLLLFVGGPNDYSSRSHKHAWNLGHIFAFSLWSYVILNLWTRVIQASFLKQCLWVLFIALFLGTLIELFQGNIGRTTSIGDVLKDLSGSLVTIAFLVPSRKKISAMNLRILQCGVLFLILWALFPLVRALIDESIARKQFPVLSNFETPFEIERWSGNPEPTLALDIVKRGKSSLKIPLSTAQYSGVFLTYFPGDWRNFGFLQLEIFNPSSEHLTLYFRVHDMLHVANGQPYDDRFNSQFILTHGWNDIKISINHILTAPANRKMDLANIRSFGIFVARLPKPEVIYIDNVRLVH